MTVIDFGFTFDLCFVCVKFLVFLKTIRINLVRELLSFNAFLFQLKLLIKCKTSCSIT